MIEGRTAFLGDADSVLGFKALGVETYTPQDGDGARRVFQSLVKDRVSVIMITEEVLEQVRDLVSETFDMPVPAVVVLPGVSGSRRLGDDALRSLIIKAVGVDLMSEED